MNGPPIEVLIRRLIDTPTEFLAEPLFARRKKAVGGSSVDVAAVVSDTFVALGGHPLKVDEARVFRPRKSARARNWLRCVLIGSWLVAHFDPSPDPSSDTNPGRNTGSPNLASVEVFLTHRLSELSDLVDAARLVDDAERREELARLLLRDLSLLPAGETQAQADDRLATLDSVNRKRVMDQARSAELRAAEVRRALESKRAAEAAAKASRE